MSRMKLLMDVVNDMDALTGSLKVLVKAMQSDEGKSVETPDTPPKEASEKPVEQQTDKKEAAYTLEDVRQALSEKSGAGFTTEVKALLERHGGSKLSQIKQEEYASIMDEVKGIGGA